MQQENLAHLIAGLSNEALTSNDLNSSLISLQESFNSINAPLEKNFLNYWSSLNTVQNNEILKLIWHII